MDFKNLSIPIYRCCSQSSQLDRAYAAIKNFSKALLLLLLTYIGPFLCAINLYNPHMIYSSIKEMAIRYAPTLVSLPSFLPSFLPACYSVRACNSNYFCLFFPRKWKQSSFICNIFLHFLKQFLWIIALKRRLKINNNYYSLERRIKRIRSYFFVIYFCLVSANKSLWRLFSII